MLHLRKKLQLWTAIGFISAFVITGAGISMAALPEIQSEGVSVEIEATAEPTVFSGMGGVIIPAETQNAPQSGGEINLPEGNFTPSVEAKVTAPPTGGNIIEYSAYALPALILITFAFFGFTVFMLMRKVKPPKIK